MPSMVIYISLFAALTLSWSILQRDEVQQPKPVCIATVSCQAMERGGNQTKGSQQIRVSVEKSSGSITGTVEDHISGVW